SDLDRSLSRRRYRNMATGPAGADLAVRLSAGSRGLAAQNVPDEGADSEEPVDRDRSAGRSTARGGILEVLRLPLLLGPPVSVGRRGVPGIADHPAGAGRDRPGSAGNDRPRARERESKSPARPRRDGLLPPGDG